MLTECIIPKKRVLAELNKLLNRYPVTHFIPRTEMLHRFAEDIIFPINPMRTL